MKQMMTTVVDDKDGAHYGLGIEKRALPCGEAWGHQGNFPGYLMYHYSSVDAVKQVTMAYNLDPNSMEAPAMAAVGQLLDDAYCGATP